MKYVDEYRNAGAAGRIIEEIKTDVRQYNRTISLMEVCGTHTMAIGKFGIRKCLPENIRLVSGPGCPVCVTSNVYIDTAIRFAADESVTLTTFGDMMRVPGSGLSLEKARASGSDIRVVYSPWDTLGIAKKNPDKQVVFLGIGFETTAPVVAATICCANEEKVDNFSVYCAHKCIPPAMELLLCDEDVRIDGFLCPGHVSVIIGSKPYKFIPEEHGIPCVIAGFELLDILQSIRMLIKSIVNKKNPEVEIQYSRCVKKQGNEKAVSLMKDVFEQCDSEWRGLGNIPGSGLRIRKKYSYFDAEKRFSVQVEKSAEHPECICGLILKGVKTPVDCSLFGKTCKPESPVGACMVSSEGTCAAYYKYGGKF